MVHTALESEYLRRRAQVWQLAGKIRHILVTAQQLLCKVVSVLATDQRDVGSKQHRPLNLSRSKSKHARQLLFGGALQQRALITDCRASVGQTREAVQAERLGVFVV